MIGVGQNFTNPGNIVGLESDKGRIHLDYETMMWLLVIEDEARLASSLKTGLEEEGYIVDIASDGIEGEDLALSNAYNAIIVDWRLPKQTGKTVIERLRLAGREYPILMLTALGDLDHRVAGLDAGADDYLSKPFKFEELLARLRALLRRQPALQQDSLLRHGELEIETRKRLVTVCGAKLDLRPKEYSLLEDLLRHREDVISRSVIAERVWGDPFFVTDNAIDVTVSGLRHKLSEAQNSEQKKVVIETVHGVGYRLTISDQV